MEDPGYFAASRDHITRPVTKYDSIDDLEADLVKMTEEVRRLRRQQSSDTDNESLCADSVIHGRTPFPELQENVDSPAQRLLRAHEQQQNKGVRSRPQIRGAQSSPSSVHEFPALTSLTNLTTDQARRRAGEPSTEKPRRPSYAQILAHKNAEHQTSMDQVPFMKSEAGRNDYLHLAKDNRVKTEDDSDGETSVRRYNIDPTRNELLDRQSELLQRQVDRQEGFPTQVSTRGGPDLSTEKRLEKRRQRRELPVNWDSVRADEKRPQQVTPRRSHVDLRTSDKSPHKNSRGTDRQSATTHGSKPLSYALPTAASKRRAAIVGSASAVSHKPSRSVPSVKTLWQDREIDVESTKATTAPSVEDLSSRCVFLKSGLDVPHDAATIDHRVKTDLMITTDHEVPAGLSRLPRPVKPGENGDSSVAVYPQRDDDAFKQGDCDYAQAHTSIVGTGKRASILAPIARRISSCDALANKADRDLATKTQACGAQQVTIDNTARVIGFADLILQKDTTSSSESTKTSASLTHIDDAASNQSNAGTSDSPKDELRIGQPHQSTPAGSLRADAPDFVPGSERMIYRSVKDSSTYDWQDPLWVPDYMWESMSYEQKREVVENRRGRGLSNVSSTNSTAVSSSSDFSTPITLDPQGNVISPRWANRRTVKTPRTLGRAPLPCVDTPSTTYTSNPSLGSSPPKGWTVGSAQPGWWYGWRGGDGKEISFSGYGPDAERDPYSPFNFRNYEDSPTKRVGLTNAQGSAKGMQVWASKRGFDRVPCPNFEIVRATENITTPENPMGWCSACLPHRSHVCGNL